MPSRDEARANQQDHDDQVPANPQARPAETVDALGEDGAESDSEEQVAAEDVTENPRTDELEGLPGPSQDEPGESAG